MNRWFRPLRWLLVALMSTLLCLMIPNGLPRVMAQTPAVVLDQTARSHYKNQLFREAADLFRQAAQAYQTAGDRTQQALSLSNLSLCYQQLGQWAEAKAAITQSLALLQPSGDAAALAPILDIHGSLLLAQGQADAALPNWEQAAKLHQQQNQPDRALISQINQARALQHLGFHRRAIALLQSVLPNKSPSEITATPEHAIALRTWGESLRSVGQLDAARATVERSLAIAQGLHQTEALDLAYLSLGNIARAQGKSDEALNFYQKAATSAAIEIQAQAHVNQLSLLVEANRSIEAKQILPNLQVLVEKLPFNRNSIDLRINLAHTMMRLDAPTRDIATLLATAKQHATAIDNSRMQSYAIGSLGALYEHTQQWQEAERLTQRALQLSQQVNAVDITYRWQWQLGRILNTEGNLEGAIAAYQGAVTTIKSLRTDLAASSVDVQFSFRDAVEPIHRQLVELLLKSGRFDHLKTARNVIESLQLVELDNFFREACLNANPALIDQVDQKAAVIYPILLDDQLAIITSLPRPNSSDRDLRYYKTDIPRTQVEQLATRLRGDLDQQNTLELTLPQLQTLYDWLLRPAIADLKSRSIETLVFVLDGALRNVPMAALHDGQQFLVEQYSIALTPGLQLLSPKAIKQERLNALVGGLSEARPPGFPALPFVENETKMIQAELPSQLLINQQFTTSQLQSRLASIPFSIVHLATHGQFSSQAEETFILTWDDTIKVNQLSAMLQSAELSKRDALELLVLSACETASGDARSALGIAGVAVRSGARSTIATLWRVDDAASATLMGRFYDELAKVNQTGISKAEALRRAQLSILRDPSFDQQPYYWAPYVLIGNWT